jgi:hypothetical protein
VVAARNGSNLTPSADISRFFGPGYCRISHCLMVGSSSVRPGTPSAALRAKKMTHATEKSIFLDALEIASRQDREGFLEIAFAGQPALKANAKHCYVLTIVRGICWTQFRRRAWRPLWKAPE